MVKRTSFHDVNLEYGAEMREMFGYYLPWEYAPGHSEEHLGTRKRASLCDIDYMGIFSIEGPEAMDLVEKLGTNNFRNQAVGALRYTAFCDANGGMVDDGTVWRIRENRFMIITGSEGDYEWIAKNAEGLNVTTGHITDQHATLAVQGPESEAILRKVTAVNLNDIRYYHFVQGQVAGVDSLIARMGYTGEAGFEVHFDAGHSSAVWKAIMGAGAQAKIVPCGQAALESLRQEAGYILVGNDHDRNTNPFEAGIGWTVKFAKPDFNGKQALQDIAREGIKRTLVWFRLPGGEIATTGDKIFNSDREVGKVTSGSFSPTFKAGTAMGYVTPQFSMPGASFEIEVAGKRCPAKLSVMPLFDPGNWITQGRP